MAPMHITELTQTLVALPLADRLAAMEALWGTFKPVEESTPEWHHDALKRGLQEIENGDVVPWEDAKSRFLALGRN
jgi:predicted transcriptional regulator